MKSKQVGSGAQRRFVIVLDTGDEAFAALSRFAREQQLKDAQFTAIGAFSRAVLGYFQWDRKEYKRIPVEEQVEVVSLMGDVALDPKGEPAVHAHVVLGKSDGAALGGHLLEGHVRPTLEIVLTEAPAALRKRKDPESGLALIDLSQS
jgi:hypothetical protein